MLLERPVPSLTARDVEDAAFALLSGIDVFERFWQRFLAELAGGLAADMARLQAELVLRLCEEEAAFSATVLEVAARVPGGESATGLSEVREWSEEVARRRAAAERLLAAATAPPPPFDRGQIAESRARRARGEDTSEDLDEVIARLKAAGRS
jgi:hypothetical protein